MSARRGNKAKAARIRRFWARRIRCLKCYSRHSAVRLLHLAYREGAYLCGAFGLLLLFTWATIRYPLECVPYVCGILAGYYIVDSVLVNTWITFVSKSPLVPIRSILLTLLNVVNVTLAFAVLYAGQAHSFKEHPLTFGTAIYFSVVTITTVGYGDIVPVHHWAKITVAAQLAVGLYLLAAVLSMVVQWNQPRRIRRR
jgi:hypothetical protein